LDQRKLELGVETKVLRNQSQQPKGSESMKNLGDSRIKNLKQELNDVFGAGVEERQRLFVSSEERQDMTLAIKPGKKSPMKGHEVKLYDIRLEEQ